MVCDAGASPRQAYHGVAPCKLGSEEVKKIRSEYLAADREERAKLEKRYGKNVIRKLVEAPDHTPLPFQYPSS